MSVASHLAVSPAGYDRRIRALIPGYDELITETALALRLATRPVRTIVDLGTGTGALARACLRQTPRARIIGIDADSAMLRVADTRLHRWRNRVTLEAGDFLDATLPPCDAMVATFSLHHIRTQRQKLAFFRKCRQSLRRGGILITGDCVPASGASAAAAALDEWFTHLARSLGSRAAARRMYESWADEDIYMPLAVEMDLLQRAGFIPDVTWRRSPFAVIAAVRP